MANYREYKEHRAVIGSGANRLDIEVYYHLGGYNYFTGEDEPRGFWVSVQPVKASRGCVEFAAFTGIKMLVKPANRFSQKGLDAAIQEAKDKYIENMIGQVCYKQNLDLVQEVREYA